MKISIITVCFNDSEGLERTILSVIHQSFHDYEYIIIDGGSKDNTLDIIKKYENHISKWVSETDQGIYDAMNKGINLANGEWLLMLNAGDIFTNEEVLNSVFKTNIPDNISVLYSDYYKYLSNGKKIRGVIDLKHRPSFNHQCTIYKKSLHFIHGMYIVTPKIIISDILFFYSIPTEQMKKIDTVIAIFDSGGISSQGNWSLQQWLCADVVFRRRSFSNMVWTYYTKRIKSIIPQDVKERIKFRFFTK